MASLVAQTVTESTCSVGNLGSIPRLGRSPGEGNGYWLQYSGLENSMDCIIHGVAESDTTEWLSLSLHFSLSIGLVLHCTWVFRTTEFHCWAVCYNITAGVLWKLRCVLIVPSSCPNFLPSSWWWITTDAARRGQSGNPSHHIWGPRGQWVRFCRLGYTVGCTLRLGHFPKNEKQNERTHTGYRFEAVIRKPGKTSKRSWGC